MTPTTTKSKAMPSSRVIEVISGLRDTRNRMLKDSSVKSDMIQLGAIYSMTINARFMEAAEKQTMDNLVRDGYVRLVNEKGDVPTYIMTEKGKARLFKHWGIVSF